MSGDDKDGWECAGELRYAQSPYGQSLKPKLQQLWRKPRYECHRLVRIDFEWRDVPTSVVPT